MVWFRVLVCFGGSDRILTAASTYGHMVCPWSTLIIYLLLLLLTWTRNLVGRGMSENCIFLSSHRDTLVARIRSSDDVTM